VLALNLPSVVKNPLQLADLRMGASELGLDV